MQCLIETRMVRWVPDERPSQRCMLAAEAPLNESVSRPYAASGRDKRRVERRRYALALSMHVAQREYAHPEQMNTPQWNLLTFLPRTESTDVVVCWLHSQREEIAHHMDDAVEQLMIASNPVPLPRAGATHAAIGRLGT